MITKCLLISLNYGRTFLGMGNLKNIVQGYTSETIIFSKNTMGAGTTPCGNHAIFKIGCERFNDR